MIRGRPLGPTCTFTPCSRGGSGAANTRRGPSCLRKQNWRTNSAADPTPPRGRSGHSNATGWPGRLPEEGTYRPDRMLIQASHGAPSRPRPHATPATVCISGLPSVRAGRPGSSAGRRFRERPLMPLRPPVAPAASGLRHPPDDGSGPDGMRDLGDFVHDLEKMRKLAGGCIRADFD